MLNNNITQIIKKAAATPAKKQHYCKNCNLELNQKVRRPWIIKNVFFFLRVRKYICMGCLKTYYVANR